MSAENQKQDELDTVVHLKAMEARIVEKFDGVQEAITKAEGQIKENGEATQEAKSQLEAVAKQYDEVYERMQALEQSSVKAHEENQEINLAKEFMNTDSFRRSKLATRVAPEWKSKRQSLTPLVKTSR